MSFLQKINLIKCISEIHFLSKFPFISENFFWNLNYLFIYLLCYVTIKTVILQLGSMLVNTGSDRTNVITWHLLDVVFNLSSLELISLKLTERNWSDIFIRLFYRFYLKNHRSETETKNRRKNDHLLAMVLRSDSHEFPGFICTWLEVLCCFYNHGCICDRLANAQLSKLLLLTYYLVTKK